MPASSNVRVLSMGFWSKVFGEENKSDQRISVALIPTAFLPQFELPQYLSLVKDTDQQLAAFLTRSPASRDPKFQFELFARFEKNSNLVLAYEKRPNKANPHCLDPLVIVRKSFVLEVALRLRANTLGQLAVELATAAKEKWKQCMLF
jgi:hypothetical protein